MKIYLIFNKVIISTAGVLFMVTYVCHWVFPKCYFYKKRKKRKKRANSNQQKKKIKCHRR